MPSQPPLGTVLHAHVLPEADPTLGQRDKGSQHANVIAYYVTASCRSSSLWVEREGSQWKGARLWAERQRRQQGLWAQSHCSQGVGRCVASSFPALCCNTPRPWLDGFQMLGSQKGPLAPPKATALASS